MYFSMDVHDPFASFGSFDSSQLLLGQATAALEEEQIDVACSYFVKAVKELSDLESIRFCHSKIAECHYRRERWRDCIASTKESISLNDSKVLYGLCLYHQKDPHTALEILNEVQNSDDLSKFVSDEFNVHFAEIEQLAATLPPQLPVDLLTNLQELKTIGNVSFKKGNYVAAINCYKDGLTALDIWLESKNSEPEKLNPIIEEFNKLYGVLLSNQLNCKMKLNNLSECRNICDKLLEVQPDWKKSHYWSAMCHLTCFEFEKSRADLQTCSNCNGSNKDDLNERIELVDFVEKYQDFFSENSILTWQDLLQSHKKNSGWLVGNLFAMSVTKIYSDHETAWHMTTSALIDNSGKITDFSAPKYEASEKDRNLINEMKRNEKFKFYIHVTQDKSNGHQKIGFSDLERLSTKAKDCLNILETEINCKEVFNVFIKKYVKI